MMRFLITALVALSFFLPEAQARRWIPKNPVASGTPVLTYQTFATDAAGSNSYSFASQAIGAAGDRDYVIVVLLSRCAGTQNTTITGCTIGGVTAAVVPGASDNRNDGGANSTICALWYAAVPTGTTATVAFTTSATMARGAIAVYTLKGASSITPTAVTLSGSASASSISLNVATPSGNSAILGAAYAAFSGDVVITWTGLDEDFENFFGTSSNITSAHRAYASAGTQTVTVAASASPLWSGLAATFQ